MFFVFGWGRQTRKNFGPVIKNRCTHCNNDDFWYLVRSSTWFTLFFVPIFPYSTDYYLLCPICDYGIELDNEKFKKFRSIAETNQLLKEKEITEIEHDRRVNRLLMPEENTSQISTASEATIKDAVIYCSGCGKETSGLSKFCKFCGNKLN